MMVQPPEQLHPHTLAALCGRKETVARIRRGRCRNCCICTAASILLAAVTLSILSCTIFKLKSPILRVHQVNLNNHHIYINNTTITANLVVSIKNPNYFASFQYGNTSTTLFYDGAVVGEARGPPGTSRARRTASMQITVEIMADRILGQPDFDYDVDYYGVVTIGGYTRIEGKLEMFEMKMRMVVKMNCSVDIDVTSWKVVQHDCKRRIKLFR